MTKSFNYQLSTEFKPKSLADTSLFKPIKVGNMNLQHRAVLAPLTRFRNHINSIPNPEAMGMYYGQRSSRPGTLVITEATIVSSAAGGYDTAPGIYNQEQIDAWSKIFKRVHDNNSYVYLQLWSLGRQSDPANLKKIGKPFVSASDVYSDDRGITSEGVIAEDGAIAVNNELRPMTIPEIKQYVNDYAQAARNSLAAGADGVEVHCGNSYMLNQFLDISSNLRTDEYGSQTLENRARFALECIDAVVEAVGADKVGVRFAPYGRFGGMSGSDDLTAIALYAYIFAELEKRAQQGKRVSYIHLVQARMTDFNINENDESAKFDTEFVYKIWKGVVMKAGAYATDPAAVRREVEVGQTLIAYGRYFISNPDLPDRLALGKPLTKYVRDSFYLPDPIAGYVDYPTYKQQDL